MFHKCVCIRTIRHFVKPPLIITTTWRRFSSPVNGKVAVVTGGAKGIGLSVARTLLMNEAKAVIMADLNVEAGEEAAKKINDEFCQEKAIFVQADATRKEQVLAVFDCALARFKTIDIFFNNAGIMSDKHWEREIKINVHAMTQNLLIAYKYMGKHNDGRGGVIVNTSSIVGLQAFHPCPIYSATKHFLIGLTRSFGHRYYECLTGVKVIAICPGVTTTELIEQAPNVALEGFGDVGKVMREVISTQPVQTTEKVGECLVKILCQGENGSIWVSEADECYKIKIPDRLTFRVPC